MLEKIKKYYDKLEQDAKKDFIEKLQTFIYATNRINDIIYHQKKLDEFLKTKNIKNVDVKLLDFSDGKNDEINYTMLINNFEFDLTGIHGYDYGDIKITIHFAGKPLAMYDGEIIIDDYDEKDWIKILKSKKNLILYLNIINLIVDYFDLIK
jgi:hypothetical protein